MPPETGRMHPTPIADSLVLVATLGMSLKAWEESGLLDREWALYRELLPHYRKIVLVTYGGEEDKRVLASLLTSDDERSKVSLVANTTRAEPAAYVQSIPALVRAILADARTVVVKTNQMAGGDAAVQITQTLRSAGLHVGLIARGGFLWTRFVTYEHGPHSGAAHAAAAHERALCSAADMVVGTTDEMVDDLAWRYGLNPGQTRVVPNYVLADGLVSTSEERDKDTLLYAGQLVKRKRVDLLIRAVASEGLRERVRLDIIGGGAERAALEDLAKSLKAPVTFSPRIPHRQLLARMAQCTIYVQASELEGHPKTVLEAMASGAPCIVAASPGLAEVIDHGSTGLRVPADADALAHAVGDLLNDAEWRDMLGSAAARVIRAKFGLPTILREEIEVHRVALARGSAQAPPQRARMSA